MLSRFASKILAQDSRSDGWRMCLQGWGRSSVLGLWRWTWRLIILPQKCSFMLLNSCNSVSGFLYGSNFPSPPLPLLSLPPKIATVKSAIVTYGGVTSASLKSETASSYDNLKKMGRLAMAGNITDSFKQSKNTKIHFCAWIMGSQARHLSPPLPLPLAVVTWSSNMLIPFPEHGRENPNLLDSLFESSLLSAEPEAVHIISCPFHIMEWNIIFLKRPPEAVSVLI